MFKAPQRYTACLLSEWVKLQSSSPSPSEQTHVGHLALGAGLGHPLAGSSLILDHRVRVLYSRYFLIGYNTCPTLTSSCFQVTLTMKYSALSDDTDLNTHITTTSAQIASIHGRGPDVEQLGLRPPAKRGSTALTSSVVEHLYLSESCFLRYKT